MERKGPYWFNCCQHPTESFVGTVIGDGRILHLGHPYDVYVWEDGVDEGVCLRDGNECADYVSPMVGSLKEYYVPAYEAIKASLKHWDIIQKKGTV